MEKLINKLQTIEGGKVLDVATGSGQFIETLSRRLKNYDQITGIDTSNRALFAGKNKFKNNEKISFLRMDANQMNFAENHFDTIAISNSLHHFKDIERVLLSMKSVLKAGGYFLVNEMCCDEDQTEAQKNHILLHHWCAKIDSYFGTVHNVTYTKAQMEILIGKLGFSDIEIFAYSFPVQNPKDEQLISQYTAMIDPYLDPLKDKPEYIQMKEEAGQLKNRIRKFGFQPAKTVFFVCKK